MALPPQYADAASLETLLCAVFRASDAPAPAARMKFRVEPPGACVVVGGDPEALLLSGAVARATDAELTFTLSPDTAHAMWSGNFNALAALGSGGLRIGGSPALALRLGGGLAPVQRAYRAALGLDVNAPD